jgi:outer membrane protein, heavy metal efflux system
VLPLSLLRLQSAEGQFPLTYLKSLAVRVAFALILAGCSSPLPYIDQSSGQEAARNAFAARRLESDALNQFLALAGQALPSKDQAWDFETLAMVSTFFNPDMAVSEAHWRETLASSEVLLSPRSLQLDFLADHHSLTEPSRPTPWAWGIGFEFVLPDADRRAAKTKLATGQVALARLEVAISGWRGRSVLRSAWIEYFAAQGRDRLAEQQLEIARTHFSFMSRRVEAGLQGRGDLQMAQDLLKRVENDRAESQRAVASQEAQLRASLHLPPNTNQLPLLKALDWEAMYAQALVLSIEKLQELALNNRLDLKEAEARYALADAKLRLEVAQQYPELNLRPGYEWDQGDHRIRLGLGLPISLPAAHKVSVDTASAERDTQGKMLLAKQELVLQELAQARLDCAAARDRLKDMTLAKQWSERALDQVKLGIRLGELDPLQGFEAEQKTMNAKSQTLEAELVFQKSLARLEDVLQQPLSTISARGSQ